MMTSGAGQAASAGIPYFVIIVPPVAEMIDVDRNIAALSMDLLRHTCSSSSDDEDDQDNEEDDHHHEDEQQQGCER
jgi:hypothetical protein